MYGDLKPGDHKHKGAGTGCLLFGVLFTVCIVLMLNDMADLAEIIFWIVCTPLIIWGIILMIFGRV
jgi:hypothetical protein